MPTPSPAKHSASDSVNQTATEQQTLNQHHGSQDHSDHEHGLAKDLQRFMALNIGRRRALVLGGLSTSALISACSNNSTAPADSTSTAETSSQSTGGTGANTASATSTDACSVIPEETQGPYPADGSSMGGGGGQPPEGGPQGGPPEGMPPQGERGDMGEMGDGQPPSMPGTGDDNINGSSPNVLGRSGIVRSDVRTSTSTGNTAEGVPLTVVFKLVNVNDGCKPLAGYALYMWHCTNDGEYSMYSTDIQNEDFLRGVQATDAKGQVSFTSIFPGCYAGRWPHIHFEIYPSLDTATSYENKLNTSQIALAESVCKTIYDSVAGYEDSINNFNNITLNSDNVFGDDGGVLQMAEVTGSIDSGYTATLIVGIEA